MRVLLALLLSASAVSAAELHQDHANCDQVAAGQGLRMERAAGVDRWCGWMMAQWDGEYSFGSARVMIAREVMPERIKLQKDRLYQIVVETAPQEGAHHILHLKYATPISGMIPLPATVLYPPSSKGGCEAIP